MSKIIVLSMDIKFKEEVEIELKKARILYKISHIFPCEYKNMFNIQFLNIDPSYHLKNIYEIYNDNLDKKNFDNFIYVLKRILLTAQNVHICLQWDGNDNEEINIMYEHKTINLFSYVFPEDEFELEYNVDYDFVYKTL